MYMFLCKAARYVPALLARAAAGDPTAIATLAALGIAAAVVTVKESKNK